MLSPESFMVLDFLWPVFRFGWRVRVAVRSSFSRSRYQGVVADL
jgi:hypothetical protein